MIRSCGRGLIGAMILIILNSRDSRSMGVHLGRGPGVSNSSSGKVVVQEAIVNSSFNRAEEEDSSSPAVLDFLENILKALSSHCIALRNGVWSWSKGLEGVLVIIIDRLALPTLPWVHILYTTPTILYCISIFYNQPFLYFC